MRIAILWLLSPLTATVTFAQGFGGPSPVSWNFSVGQDSGRQVLNADAKVDEGWYVYSQFLAEGGPVPTSIDLSETEGLELLGRSAEHGPKLAGHDDLFDMEIVSYKDSLRIVQPVGLPAGTKRIVGVLEFMTCNGKVCLPPSEVPIAVNVPRG